MDNWSPRVKLFAGKAAASYHQAKLIIKLAHDVARVINSDPTTRGILKVVFLPNYSVSLAETIIPAADLSEQISTAGMEASGTGNMKFALNGALTIGTLDGATNIEILERVGAENIFIFGLEADGVAERRARGLDAGDVIGASPALAEVLDAIQTGVFSPDERDRYRGLVDGLRYHDYFMVCADFVAYYAAQRGVTALWRRKAAWRQASILNTAGVGWFSSDRARDPREHARTSFGGCRRRSGAAPRTPPPNHDPLRSSSPRGGCAPVFPMTEADIDAIVAARHPDPFSVLGPHETSAGLVIRAFVPGATALWLLDDAGARIAAFTRRHDAGFFETRLADRQQRFPYRLHAHNAGGAWDLHDPYAFPGVLGAMDDYLLLEGTHRVLYERLGAHPMRHEGVDGVQFAVWAPNASRASVVGDFNDWDGRRHQMRKRIDSGVWEIFAPGVTEGAVYKYEIIGRDGRLLPLKADPLGFAAELRPSTASVVARTGQSDMVRR